MRLENIKDHTTKRPDYISLIMLIVHFAFVFFPIFFATHNGFGIVTVFSWLWFGIFVNGIINLMHETTHRLTFKEKSYCDILGEFFLGPLLIADFSAYRDRHWIHHHKFGTSDDTKYIYLKKIKGLNLIKFLIECLILKEGIKKFFNQFANKDSKKISLFFVAKLALIQVIIISLIFFSLYFLTDQKGLEIIFNSILSYFFVYLYGLASLGVFFSSLRAIAEHQLDEIDEKNEMIVGKAVLRNLKCNIFTNLIFGSYGFAEHATHHKNPRIPSYNLEKFRKIIQTQNEQMIPRRGYFEILKNCIAQQ